MFMFLRCSSTCFPVAILLFVQPLATSSPAHFLFVNSQKTSKSSSKSKAFLSFTCMGCFRRDPNLVCPQILSFVLSSWRALPWSQRFFLFFIVLVRAARAANRRTRVGAALSQLSHAVKYQEKPLGRGRRSQAK